MYSELFNNLRKNNISNNSNNIYIIVIIISWIFIILFFYYKSSLYAHIIPDYLSFIRTKIFSKTIEFYKNNYKDIKIGKFIGRLLSLSRIFKNIMIDILDQVFPLLMAILLINIYFFYLNIGVGLISSIGFSIMLFVIYILSKKIILNASPKEKKFNDMTEKLHDSFSNLMNVYLNNQDASEINKNKLIETKQSNLLKVEYNNLKDIVFYLSIASAVTFSLIIYYSYSQYKTGNLDTKKFINILVILIGYFSYLMRISKLFPQLLAKMGIIHNSKDFLNQILNNKVDNNKLIQYNKGSIVFDSINFQYPHSKNYIFKDLTFEIKNNEKIALMGTSGTGKTTLIKLLLKMYKLTSGNIKIDNKNINSIDTNTLRKKINYINQRTSLFDNSVINNIKYGNNLTDDEIKKTLKKYELDNIFLGLHEGIYEEAGVNGTNLSLGMQKITMIMRGMLKSGDIIIYDEPLAGLDSNTREKVIKMIIDNSKNKTIIIITHNKEIIPHMDRIINLNDFNKI
jgi:ABC-type multidrug transport system fused ATPase/permease subunit